MKPSSVRILLLVSAVVASLAIVPVAWGAAKSHDKVPMPDFTQGGKIPAGTLDVTHDWTLGATGARGWVYGWQGQTSEARQILVTQVAKGSPADGVLATGDVILGGGGRAFGEDARIELAKALTAAEQESNGGVLKLTRWRAGESANVQLQLQVLGSYSGTAPYACPKSAKIFERGCQAIAKKGLNGVSMPNDLNGLALLASGKQEYRPLLAAYAKQVAAFHIEQYATWHYGYANMFLAEYVLATHDTSVLDGVKRLAMDAANGQSGVGTWGHKFARPDGNLNGYGCMNQPGLSLTLSMVLARQAGVQDPVLDRAITKAAGFLRWYVNKGGIPYGDHGPWPSHEDNGKCSSAAVLFDLLGDREAASFFSRMGTAAYDERERGHTGNFFNVLWAMPGVSRGGPLATGAYLKEVSWYYDLARSWDGSFDYQGEPAGGQEHGKYTRWDCTGAYLLAYALPLKSLYLTGKQACVVPALTAKEVALVIAAGRDLVPVNGKDGYDARSNDELLAGLASWSTALRHRSAKALGRRQGDFVPILTRMLAGSERDARYGACEALGAWGPQADAAAPQLRALVKGSDPWLQGLACKALMNLSPAARNASVNDLLAMMVRPNPADPRRMLQRDASVVLFARSPGVHDGPQSLLADSLEGVDRHLLYPAVRSGLQNEDSVVRSAIGKGVFDKLTNQDLAILLPDIVTATEKLAPSDEMFGDGVRLAGLDLLARLHIREGMPLCVSVMEFDRWGSGKRVPGCMASLRKYGANAKQVLPQLRKISQDAGGGNKDIDKLIADIEASTVAPPLVSLKEFIAHAAAGGDAAKGPIKER